MEIEGHPGTPCRSEHAQIPDWTPFLALLCRENSTPSLDSPLSHVTPFNTFSYLATCPAWLAHKPFAAGPMSPITCVRGIWQSEHGGKLICTQVECDPARRQLLLRNASAF